MALNLPVNGNDREFKRVSAGSHIAVCNLVADCGLQPGSDAYPDPKRKLYIRFEIPAERVSYEKNGEKMEGPQTIGSFYTASMGEKANLRHALEGWRGRAFTNEEAAAFDVASILGKACMLSVVERVSNGKTYVNIVSIGSLPKGLPVPKAENALLYYDEENRGEFDDLPKWLQEKIDGQLTPATPATPATPTENESHVVFEDDDLPF